MTSTTQTINSIAYTASASSTFATSAPPTFMPYAAFNNVFNDNAFTNSWLSGDTTKTATSVAAKDPRSVANASTFTTTLNTLTANGLTFFDNKGEWLQLQLGTAKIITQYTIYGGCSANYLPTAWMLCGSNNGTSFTLLDNRLLLNSSEYITATGNPYTASFTNSTAYTYYRLIIKNVNTAATTDNCGIGELQLFGP